MRRVGISHIALVFALVAGVVIGLALLAVVMRTVGGAGRVGAAGVPGVAAAPAPEPLSVGQVEHEGVPAALFSCAQCHAMPPAETLARDDWPRLIERMNALIAEYELGEPLSEDALRQVTAHYTNLAPESLETIPPPEGNAAARFVGGPIGRPPTPPPEGRPPVLGVLSTASISSPSARDVLVPDIGEGRVSLIARTGNSFTEVTLADVPAPCVATSADMDADGDEDVLVASLGQMMPTDELTGAVYLLENRGRGAFSRSVLLDRLARVADVEPSDLDGDGDLDVLFAAFGLYNSGEIGWLEQTSPSEYEYRAVLQTNGATHVRPADFDGDGLTDFVALLSQQHEAVLLFHNLGGGRFASSDLYRAAHPLWGMSSLSLSDLDGDGDLDVIVTNGDALDQIPTAKPYHGVSWLENLGGLEFAHHRIGASPGAYCAAVADFDLDGDMDVVVSSMMNDWADPANQSLTLFENDGAQTFTARPVTNSPTWQVSVVATDLNGDGRPDLVSSGMYVMPPFARVGRVAAFLNASAER